MYSCPEPWQEAEEHYRKQEADFKKYGTGRCRECGVTMYNGKMFCEGCIKDAMKELVDYMDRMTLSELERIYRETVDGFSISRRDLEKLYDMAADRIADFVVDEEDEENECLES